MHILHIYALLCIFWIFLVFFWFSLDQIQYLQKELGSLSALVFRPGSYYTNTRLHSFLSVLTPESESGGIGGSTVFDFMSY